MKVFTPNTVISSADINGNFAELVVPYKFSVYLNAAQNTSAGAFATVLFDAKDFDTGSNVDIVTNKGRFTCPKTGYYQLNATISTGSSVGSWLAALYKNGNEIKRGSKNGVTGNFGSVISEFVYLVAGDYVEVRIYCPSVVAIETSSINTHFSGYLVSIN